MELSLTSKHLMIMKRHHILCISILLSFAACLPIIAQDDVEYDEVEETVVKKKVQVKKPQYPKGCSHR